MKSEQTSEHNLAAASTPAFPPIMPMDSIREILAAVRTGNFNLQTVTQILWVVGCLLASLGGVPISQGTDDSGVEYDLSNMDKVNIINACEKEIGLCSAGPDGVAQKLPPGTIMNIIKLLLGLLPFFIQKTPT